MPLTFDPISDEQRAVLEAIYHAFLESEDWPTYAYLDSSLESDDIELNDTLSEMPEGLYSPNPKAQGTVWFADDEQLGLRAAGLAHCRGSEDHLMMFLAVLRWLAEERQKVAPTSPQDVPRVERRSADLITPLRSLTGGDPLVRDLKLMLELMRAEPDLPSWSGDVDDVTLRTFVIDREIRRFRDVETIEQFVEIVRPQSVSRSRDASSAVAAEPAVDLEAAVPAGADRRRRRRKYRHDVGARFGRWTLKTQLGAGGNAEVWRGQDAETGEIAAVKILHADRTDDDAYARFRREVDSINELAGKARGSCRSSTTSSRRTFTARMPGTRCRRPSRYAMPSVELGL
jgi:hypothetical protein